MKTVISVLTALVFCSLALSAQETKPRIIIFGAHPDDCDHNAGGSAILWAKMGCKVKFVSMTNGDAGHQSMGGGALAKRRMAEAAEAGKRFGVDYLVMDNHDGELLPTLENRLKVIREIRNWKADLVITHPPDDYHPDHRYTSILVQDAAYMVIVPNVAPDTPPLKTNPVFMYHGTSSSGVAVAVDAVFEQKIFAMAAHESQYFEWLPWTNGKLEEVPANSSERLKYLAARYDYDQVNPELKKIVEKTYGTEFGRKVKHAEPFYLTPYGRVPSESELKWLFPMTTGTEKN
jgi:LmbE family N-acetylglucosaminyl deacetylase